MSHTVRGLPPGRVTVTDYSNPTDDGAAHHFDVADDGSVTVGTGDRLDLLLSVYPEAVASEVTTPPPSVVDTAAGPAGPAASGSRKSRGRSTS
jgi:hypothetical protein